MVLLVLLLLRPSIRFSSILSRELRWGTHGKLSCTLGTKFICRAKSNFLEHTCTAHLANSADIPESKDCRYPIESTNCLNPSDSTDCSYPIDSAMHILQILQILMIADIVDSSDYRYRIESTDCRYPRFYRLQIYYRFCTAHPANPTYSTPIADIL